MWRDGIEPADHRKMRGEARRSEMARIMATKTGVTQKRLAELFGVTVQTVAKDMRKIRRAWRDEMIESVEKVVAQDLAELAMVKGEAWRVYADSVRTRPRVETVTEGVKGSTVTVTETDPKPDLRALDMVLDCMKVKRKVMGLDQARSREKGPRAFAFTVKIGEKVITAESSTVDPEVIADAEYVELDSTGRHLTQALPPGESEDEDGRLVS